MHLPEPKTVALLLLLLTGAAGSTFLLVMSRGDEATAGQPQLSFNYYLDEAELRGTAEDGRILYEVRAQRAEQNSTDTGIEVRLIEMTYGPPSGLPWQVRADRGRIGEDAGIISLSGNVVAISGNQQPQKAVIKTSSLNIDPRARKARSNQRVALQFGDKLLNATGMEADFANNTLKLLANVNGKFNR